MPLTITLGFDESVMIGILVVAHQFHPQLEGLSSGTAP
jgi:hypothetical protein